MRVWRTVWLYRRLYHCAAALWLVSACAFAQSRDTAYVRERALKGGNEIVAGGAEQLVRDMRAEQGLWSAVIRAKNIKPE